jgi:hypothetical protein
MSVSVARQRPKRKEWDRRRTRLGHQKRIASMIVCEPINALVHPSTPGHRCRTAQRIPAAIAPAIRSSAMIPAAPP